MIRTWIVTFAHDDKLTIALIALVLDFLLGVIAAFRLGTFRLSYVYDFARNDVLFKLIPWFIFYVLALVAGGVDIVIPGLDLGLVAGAMYALMLAAWVGSILNSLTELGIKVPPAQRSVRAMLTGSENAAPPKD
jgi:hypothetical protein